MINKEDPKMMAGEFGLMDLNIGYFLPAIEAGWQITGLPVFSKRKPAYQLIFCHADSGIRTPRDLASQAHRLAHLPNSLDCMGQRLAARTLRRGFLERPMGLAGERSFPVHDQNLKIEYVDESKNMAQRLIAGELDAILTDISDTKMFDSLESHPKIKRLFPDYLKEDEQLYRDTGIYTPVHMIVMSRKLDRAQPELAAKFYAAFEKAKQIAYDDILSDRGGFSVVYLRERMKEQMATWGDPWKYGIKANKTTIDAFIKYNVEQGMIRAAPSYADIFAAGTLDT